VSAALSGSQPVADAEHREIDALVGLELRVVSALRCDPHQHDPRAA